MILSSREKLLLMLTAAVLVLALGDHYVLTPMLERRSQTEKELVRVTGELENARGWVARQRDLRRRWRWSRIENDTLDSGLTTEQAKAEFLRRLHRKAQAENLTLMNVQPVRGRRNVGDSGEEEEIAVELKLRCSLDRLSRLLYRLGSSKDLLRVFELRITPAGKSSDELNAVVRVSTLLFRDPTADGALGQNGRNGRNTRRR